MLSCKACANQQIAASHKHLRWLFLLLYGGVSLWQSGFATIIVTSGGSQTVPASSDSADIVFKVIDEFGNPNTGVRVNLSLVNPKGDIMTVGLSSYGGSSDNNGQVSTRLYGTRILGNYTITATLAMDTTQFTGTNVIVTAGAVADFRVIEGYNQSIPAGKDSANIRFQLTDAFNNAVPDELVNFTAENPDGDRGNSGLSTILATSDVNGEVMVRLKATETHGIYTVIATLATNDTITTNTQVQVKKALPKLPSLGFGGTIDPSGNTQDTREVSFNGGISVNGGEFEQEAVFTIEDYFMVQGVIKVDPNHVEKTADIIVVASYKPLPPAETEIFFMFDNLGVPKRWEGNMSKLEALKNDVILDDAQVVNIYEGQLTIGARLRFFFGYRLDNGVIVFNADQTINARIRE